MWRNVFAGWVYTLSVSEFQAVISWELGREGVHCKVDVGVDDDKSLVFMTGLCFCEIWFLTLSVCL